MKRLLIANRGEIARRVARTCRRLGIEYCCVYSDADRDSPHLEGAAASVHIGGSPPAESYLHIERVVQAALQTGCDAVHPGYGFLSENAAFARRVEEAGLVFVGPEARTIALLGDKAKAKESMRAAGVPTVPGSATASLDIREIGRRAQEAGLPVLLKPSAGGGGKGMVVIRNLQELQAGAEQAIRLAAANFGDGRLLVERFLENPRHIEVQVFGDGRGNAVHVFERECSLQRRHQKVIEEAPAIRLRPEVRQALLAAAVRGAESIGYRNAGTFEFIVNDADEFFFLEVNTRLQVEHPVSEEITGLDFVEWQLRIAGDGRLPMQQHEIHCKGSAVEARIYAEDPADGFRPAPGRATHVRWPDEARVEAAVRSGSAVPPFYDPMIAKIITKGDDRAAALAALQAALRETEILGLTTNVGFLLRVLADESVQAGDVHTHYLDQHAERLTRLPAEAEVAGMAASMRAMRLHAQARQAWPLDLQPLDRAHLGGGGGSAAGGIVVLWRGGRRHDVRLVEVSSHACRTGLAVVNGAFDSCTGVVKARTQEHRLAMCAVEDRLEFMVDGDRWTFHDLSGRPVTDAEAGNAAVAPMHGVVAAILVRPGEHVVAGQTLLVVEAMKMENAVTAASDGVVRKVLCELRQQVASGQVLVAFEPREPTITE